MRPVAERARWICGVLLIGSHLLPVPLQGQAAVGEEDACRYEGRVGVAVPAWDLAAAVSPGPAFGAAGVCPMGTAWRGRGGVDVGVLQGPVDVWLIHLLLGADVDIGRALTREGRISVRARADLGWTVGALTGSTFPDPPPRAQLVEGGLTTGIGLRADLGLSHRLRAFAEGMGRVVVSNSRDIEFEGERIRGFDEVWLFPVTVGLEVRTGGWRRR